MMTDRPSSPGVWAEHYPSSAATAGERPKFIRITEPMIAERDAMAVKMGYVKRYPCTFCSSGVFPCENHAPHPHFICYESVALNERGFASEHMVHDRSHYYKFGPGIIILAWPDPVTKAFTPAE